MSPPKPGYTKYGEEIMQCLNENPIHEKGRVPAKPHLTFKEILDIMQKKHPTISRSSVAGNLNKLVEMDLVLRYSSGKSELDRRYPTFYRLNPETDGEIKWCIWRPGMTRTDDHDPFFQHNYNEMTENRRLGKAVYYGVTRGIFRVEKLLPAKSHVDTH
jgi:hypothetical protein